MGMCEPREWRRRWRSESGSGKMTGQRSSDQNYVFGFPCDFLGNILPKDKEVVSHAHFLRHQNTSLVAKAVTRDIFAIWSHTEIPCYGTTCVKDRVERLLGRAKRC